MIGEHSMYGSVMYLEMLVTLFYEMQTYYSITYAVCMLIVRKKLIFNVTDNFSF